MKSLRVLEERCCAPGAPPLPKETAQALAARFKALSDPARVSIVNLLAGAGAICVCELTSPLGLSQPTVSHHLRVLKEAGLIEVARRSGTWTYYRLVPEAVEQLAFALGGASEPGAGIDAGDTRERALAS
jgi:ArsR family transcriptional regulator